MLGEAKFGMTAEQREEWLPDGFIKGMRDVSRKIKFIHRVPLTKGDNDNSTRKSAEEITRRTLHTFTCIESPISDLYKETPLQHYNRNDDKYFHWSKVYNEVKDELDWLRHEVPKDRGFPLCFPHSIAHSCNSLCFYINKAD